MAHTFSIIEPSLVNIKRRMHVDVRGKDLIGFDHRNRFLVARLKVNRLIL